jgi:hypothetical protein
MLTNPREIGGIVSNSEQILDFAKKSLTWKAHWPTATGYVTVDHAKLLEQGALPMVASGEEQNHETTTTTDESSVKVEDLGKKSEPASND